MFANAVRSAARPLAQQCIARSAFPAMSTFHQAGLMTDRTSVIPRAAPQTALSPSTAAAVQAIAPLGARSMTSWRLRPYAAAGVMGALPLTTLSAGFSKVNLSLMVMPWKALPAALVLLPMASALPAAYRFVFNNASRHTTASVFSGLLYFVLSFLPVPCFENLFSELTFYFMALISTFFIYSFFPEVLLNDFMFMHYVALFTIPLIPLAFTFMPMLAARSYFFL